MTINQKPKLIIVSGDDVFDCLSLNSLIPDLIEQGVQPVLVSTIGGKSKPHGLEVDRYFFYKSDLFQKVVIPYLEKMVLPSKQDQMFTPGQLAVKYGLERANFDPIKGGVDSNAFKNFVAEQKNQGAVGVISLRNMQIFAPDTIHAIKNNGMFLLNTHPAVLKPNGSERVIRGVMSPMRAWEFGHSQIGVTLHEMESGIDTGPIVAHKTVPMDRNDSLIRMFEKLAPLYSDLISGFMRDYLYSGAIKSEPQTTDQTKIVYCSYPGPEKIQKLLNEGFKFTNPEEIIDLYIRFFSVANSVAEHPRRLRTELTAKMSAWERKHALAAPAPAGFGDALKLKAA